MHFVDTVDVFIVFFNDKGVCCLLYFLSFNGDVLSVLNENTLSAGKTIIINVAVSLSTN